MRHPLRTIVLSALASLALTPSAFAGGKLVDDALVMEQVMLASVATNIANQCKKIEVDPTATAKGAAVLMTHISAEGYDASEIQGLQSPEYLEKMGLAAQEFLSANEVDPTNKRALCAFAKREMKEGTSALSKLLMKNR